MIKIIKHNLYLVRISILFLTLFLNTNNGFAKPFNELLKKILIDDENINSSKFMVKKAQNDLSSIYSTYTPKIDFTVPFGSEKLINNDSANTNLDFYEFTAKVTQNIYDFGSTSSKIEKAENQLKLSEISKDNVKSNKIFEAIASYLNYIKAYKILEHSKKSEERIREVTQLENEKVARGAGLASNVLQSKARLAGAKSTRVKFQGDLAIATNRFYNIFRELPAEIENFSTPKLPIELLPKTEDLAIKIAKKNNISLNLSNLNLKNTQSNIKNSKSKFFPSIRAIAEYKNKRNVSGLEGTEIDQIYKLEMNYPISIGGPYGFFYKESSDYKSAINQYMVAKYGHEKMERNLEETVRNAWQTKEIVKQNYEYLENQANISGEFFDLAMKEVKLGNRQLIDILSSETAYINAKSASESANTDYQLAIYQLLLSVGTLDEKIFKNNKKTKKLEKKVSNNKSSKKIKKRKKEIKPAKMKILENKKLSKLIINKEEKKNLQKQTKVEVNNLKKQNQIEIKNPTSLLNLKEVNEKAEVIKNNKKNNENLNNSEKIESKEKINKNLFGNETDISEKYKIQLGAFSNVANANNLLKKILDENVENILLNLEANDLEGLFKIRSIETFNKERAKEICEQFTSSFFNCIIKKI